VARRGRVRALLLILLIAVTGALAIGSLLDIHAQSSDFRTSTNTGYGALALRVVDASNQTGARLARLMDQAPQLPNQLVPRTARAEIQQGLDQAVSSTSGQATQAAGLVPPYPTGSVSARFTKVMSERATATSALRATVDRLLGMEPLPVAGAPSSSTPKSPVPMISTSQATATMTAAGLLFQQADHGYRELLTYVREQRIPIHLPGSVWVPSPVASAPLGSVRLGAAATSLANSAALIPFHQLVITAVGLSPPAVPCSSTACSGIVGDSCSAPQSTVPGPSPTVLPPSTSISTAVTVTNCGTVTESGVVVSQVLALADPAGTAPPRDSARGGRSELNVTVRSGSSVALSLPPLSVARGHRYTLTLAVAVPPNQHDLAGTSQQFLVQISS
jgi:hypothetical protein